MMTESYVAARGFLVFVFCAKARERNLILISLLFYFSPLFDGESGKFTFCVSFSVHILSQSYFSSFIIFRSFKGVTERKKQKRIFLYAFFPRRSSFSLWKYFRLTIPDSSDLIVERNLRELSLKSQKSTSRRTPFWLVIDSDLHNVFVSKGSLSPARKSTRLIFPC